MSCVHIRDLRIWHVGIRSMYTISMYYEYGHALIWSSIPVYKLHIIDPVKRRVDPVLYMQVDSRKILVEFAWSHLTCTIIRCSKTSGNWNKVRSPYNGTCKETSGEFYQVLPWIKIFPWIKVSVFLRYCWLSDINIFAACQIPILHPRDSLQKKGPEVRVTSDDEHQQSDKRNKSKPQPAVTEKDRAQERRGRNRVWYMWYIPVHVVYVPVEIWMYQVL